MSFEFFNLGVALHEVLGQLEDVEYIVVDVLAFTRVVTITGQ